MNTKDLDSTQFDLNPAWCQIATKKGAPRGLLACRSGALKTHPAVLRKLAYACACSVFLPACRVREARAYLFFFILWGSAAEWPWLGQEAAVTIQRGFAVLKAQLFQEDIPAGLKPGALQEHHSGKRDLVGSPQFAWCPLTSQSEGREPSHELKGPRLTPVM